MSLTTTTPALLAYPRAVESAGVCDRVGSGATCGAAAGSGCCIIYSNHVWFISCRVFLLRAQRRSRDATRLRRVARRRPL